MNATDVKYIVIHCTAGFGDLKSIKKHWHNVLGWKTGGYHRIVKEDGKTHKLYPFHRQVNGVKGHNHEAIHISYIGGVDPKNYSKAKDTRTNNQNDSIIKNIIDAMCWLSDNGNDLSQVKILGHRDFSPDKNGNGIIESWERIKECPSFEVSEEYAYLQPI